MAVNAQVERHSNESFDRLLKRFRKEVSKSGALTVVRRKRWHVSNSEERRFKRKKAIRRTRRQQSRKDR